MDKKEERMMIKMSVYASSDWHGNLKATKYVLNKFLQPEDTLYFLGDCADRGLSGIPVFDMLTKDPRVIFIKGNHEVFMEEGIIRWRKYGMNALNGLWKDNGGEQTAQAIENSNDNDNVRRLSILHDMPVTVSYTNKNSQFIILDHCGFTPFYNKIEKKIYPADHYWEPMWDRSHFRDEWPEDKEYANIYIVHGHTPLEYLPYHYFADGIMNDFPKDRSKFQYNEPIYYADGHKIDIDIGTWATNKVCLIDLDNLNSIVIDLNNVKGV